MLVVAGLVEYVLKNPLQSKKNLYIIYFNIYVNYIIFLISKLHWLHWSINVCDRENVLTFYIKQVVNITVDNNAPKRMTIGTFHWFVFTNTWKIYFFRGYGYVQLN